MRASNISLVGSEPAVTPSASSSLPGEDPVPAQLHAVVELFATELAKVSFPEIDAAALRRHADELRAEAKVVARAREALDAARAAFAARLTASTDTCTRAIAYARIYSEAHPDRSALAAAVAALSGPAAPPVVHAPAGKRRGRPPRRSAELFDAAAAESAPEDSA